MIRPSHPLGLSALALAAGALACGAPGPVQPAPGPPVTGPPAPQVRTAEPPTAAPAAETGAARPVEPPPAAAVDQSPLHPIAYTDHDLRLFALDGGILADGGPILTEIKDDRLVRDERFREGLPPYWASYVVNVVGKWPSDALMTLVSSDGRVGWGEVYRWSGQRWQQVGAPLARTWLFTGAAAWSQGRVLALSASSMLLGTSKAGTTAFKVLAGPGGPPGLSVTPTSSTDPDSFCRTAIEPQAFHALPEGHVFIAGLTCPGGTLGTETWTPGEKRGRVTDLDAEGSPGGSDPVFAARGASEVYLGARSRDGKPFLARFDGKEWRADVPPPASQGIRSLAVEPDGSLWAVTRQAWGGADAQPGELWRRQPGKAWAKVPLPVAPPRGKLPEGASLWEGASSVVVDGRGDVWVAAGGAVLRNRPGQAPAEYVSWPILTQLAAASFRLPKAARPDCESVFALFFTFSKVTPDDYDFPLTRKALKGQTQFSGARFVVTREGGRKFFGAMAPDYETGRKMVARVQREVAGSTPQLLCAKPEVVRELKLNLRTGEVEP